MGFSRQVEKQLSHEHLERTLNIARISFQLNVVLFGSQINTSLSRKDRIPINAKQCLFDLLQPNHVH